MYLTHEARVTNACVDDLIRIKPKGRNICKFDEDFFPEHPFWWHSTGNKLTSESVMPRFSDIWGISCQKQVSQAGITNYIPRWTAGLLLIPAWDTCFWQQSPHIYASPDLNEWWFFHVQDKRHIFSQPRLIRSSDLQKNSSHFHLLFHHHEYEIS